MTDKSKFRNHAPFGFREIRWPKWGLHPDMFEKSGAKDVGPMSYYPKEADCKYKNGMDWGRKMNLEEYSQWMGWKNLPFLEKRHFLQTLVGPGVHEIDPSLFKQQSNSIFRDIHFTVGKRYSYIKDPNAPSPDRYFQNYKKLSTLKSTITDTPTFEWDGFVNRFKLGTPPKRTLPPNMYKVIENDGRAIADILKKRISIRGPYDLFTGPRDETTLKGFWGPRTFKLPDCVYNVPTSLELLLNHKNFVGRGKFLRQAKFPKKPTLRNMLIDLSLCYKNPNDPGPATYNTSHFRAILPKSPGSYPFDTSVIHARPTPARILCPGPGRYNTKIPRYMKLKRHTSVFLTKYPRIYYREFNYRSF